MKKRVAEVDRPAAGRRRAGKIAWPDKPSVVEVGRQLSQARETETFAELCHDLGIGVRAAYYLVVIADAVDDDRFAEQDVEDVGWTKARVLIEADLPKKQLRGAVAYARTHSVPELQDWLKTGRISRRVPRLFYLSETQVRLLDEALIGMGARQAQSGLVGRTRALMALVRRAGQQSQANQGGVPDEIAANRGGNRRKRGTDRRKDRPVVGQTGN